MSTAQSQQQVLVGPRYLDRRICRLVYRRDTDEVWTEEWRTGEWVRTTALLRHVLKAPPPKPSQLRGVPAEAGVWDREQLNAG